MGILSVFQSAQTTAITLRPCHENSRAQYGSFLSMDVQYKYVPFCLMSSENGHVCESLSHTIIILFCILIVGYFNYRYFCNFLLYVFLGMFYGAVISFRPFRAITSYQRGQTGDLWAPARQNESAVAFSFMLCLSVGFAVLSLGGFHAYLVLTAQTTIEFHGT
jgi:hypothetical protein